MNDNLRNISLQYIKGKNYEKITCFHSDDIVEIKKILTEDSYTEKNYNILEKILKVEKREIGESLLDDLINYISFKDLKDPIKDAINVKKESLKDKKKDEKDANKESFAKIKELTTIKKDLEEKNNKLKDLSDVDYNNNDLYEFLITNIFDKLASIYNINNINNINNIDKTTIIDQNRLQSLINNYTKDLDKDYINEYISQQYILLFDKNINFDKKEDAIKFAEKVLIFLTILMNLEKEINEGKKAANKSSIDNLEKLIKIFKKYLYICENNIKKYEKIFDHNEIGNIDEAFMIESYSKFLKKLYKLKQNLETKDTKKIKRELINSLDQFFNLHGFNNPEKIESKAEIEYIVQRILNYT
jgi:hypothetical protein